jgi:putative hydrolase of the HAD superfamily
MLTAASGRIEAVTEGERNGVRKIEAVFFDAGNTLLKPHPSMEEVCMEVLAAHGYAVTPEELDRGLQESEKYYEDRYWTDDTFWASEAEAEEMWTRLYALLMRELGVADPEGMGAVMYDEFGKGSRWALFDDVLPALRALSEAGLLMGIISNWDARLSSLCLELDLSPYLHFVISSACVGRIKPEPSIFRMALQRAGVGAEHAIHVGDHYYADVLGARSVGLTPVLIDRAGRAERAGSFDCLVIRSLTELPALLPTLQ